MTGLSATETGILERIKQRQADMAAQVVDWAQVNSGSRNLDGLERMRSLIAARLHPVADTVETVPPEDVTTLDEAGNPTPLLHGSNLLARKRIAATRRIILTGHMDTVFPADHAFQSCQLTEPDRLNGPGTADMKGGLIVMIEALSALEAAGVIPDLGWDVVVNADEEVSSLGSARLLRETARRCQIGMTFEPSVTVNGTLASARRGSGNFLAVLTGRTAHAGRNPEDGRNAVIAAADLALRLDGLKQTIKGLSVNVARMTGGGANNVVPDRARLSWNMRPVDHEGQHSAEEAIPAIIADIQSRHEVDVALSGSFARPPKPFDARHQALFGLVRETGADLGQTIDWQPSGGVCDGNNIAAENVVVVDTMGVRGGAIHTEQEFMILSSMSERAALAAITILRIAQGRLDDALARQPDSAGAIHA
ncbi:MAG: hydrolase [Alphaproteobacteria bacterium]|nr:hydrolase [Alphaproteobacteria bacterium]MBU0793360.1 hydrolase [Alphaproteobacteria bacterium]MBU0876307.1 hydrolase [Alphaproteobacteria bacterium]MBU1768232.1 hydrolase [Alphaproteobacteria bacterium]